jgi:hypothetical protein
MKSVYDSAFQRWMSMSMLGITLPLDYSRDRCALMGSSHVSRSELLPSLLQIHECIHLSIHPHFTLHRTSIDIGFKRFSFPICFPFAL